MQKAWSVLITGICVAGLNCGFVSAATVTGTSPVVHTGIPELDAALNQAIGAAFDDAIAEANDSLSRYSDQQDLGRGFGNANAYSSQVATLQGFQNYSRVAIASGVMVGLQAPSTNPDYYDDFEDHIRKDGDLFAGVGAGVSYLNIGVNAKFIHPGLYLNLKFGSLDLKPTDEARVGNTVIGIGANYSLAKASRGSSLFKWRGLSVGSGITYHNSSLSYELELDELTEDFEANIDGHDVEGEVVVDPSVNLDIEVTTMTFQADITTAAQVLWLLNFTAGAGLDINFGKTDISVASAGSATVDNLNAPGGIVESITDGRIVVDGSTKGISPSFGRFRLMTGVGFNIGPAKIDIPIIYYIKSGASAGVTVGVVL